MSQPTHCTKPGSWVHTDSGFVPAAEYFKRESAKFVRKGKAAAPAKAEEPPQPAPAATESTTEE